MSEYSRKYYLEHRKAIRLQQAEYHQRNKDVIREKYRHHRTRYDKANRAYLNEHAYLRKALNAVDSELHPTKVIELKAKKEYLRYLHAKNLI